MKNFSADQARRLFLHAQGFCDPAPKGNVNRNHMRRAMARLQLLQLDSVPVIIRSQYLPLYSRLGPYRTQLLDDTAYQHNEWFECWSHEANLMPVAREPLFRWHKRRSEQGETWAGLYKLAQAEPAYVQSILDEVTERGELAGGDLLDPRPPKKKDDWWAGRSMGLLALDWLYRTGKLGVRRDQNFHRTFDLIERIVPAEILAQPTPSEQQAQRQLIELSAQSMGVATAKDLADYFRLPITATRKLVAELVEDGRLEPVTVQGWDKPAFKHPKAKLPRRVEARAFLSPFDPVVWCRPRAERIFDFAYRIEIYVPKPKRQYGYYVLPFLMGDRLVGRADIKTHRKTGVLEVIAAYVEDGQQPAEVARAMAEELPRLAQLVGVDEVVVSCQKRFGRQLRTEQV